MRNKLLDSFPLAISLFLAAPLGAHHSISAEFDTSKSFSVEGTLTKVEWVNPHVYIYVDAKDENGVVVAYALEAGPPGGLRRAGVLKTLFNVGDQLTIEAYATKDGTKNLGLVKSVILPDGHKIVIGRDPSEVEKANKSE